MDRNDNGAAVAVSDLESLSARRAWIEISGFYWWVEGDNVALRKESVDRNGPSQHQNTPLLVALRKESVDRNLLAVVSWKSDTGRSPQGERG